MSQHDDDIARVHAQDVAAARKLIREAIQKAGERWLPVDAVADAMMIELVVVRGRAPMVIAPATPGSLGSATYGKKLN